MEENVNMLDQRGEYSIGVTRSMMLLTKKARLKCASLSPGNQGTPTHRTSPIATLQYMRRLL